MIAQNEQDNIKPTKVILWVCRMTMFTLLLYSCAGYKQINSSADENEGWTFVKAEKGSTPTWKAYSRKLAGTNFIEYKIEGNVASTAESCVTWFKQDIHELAEGSKGKKYTTYEIVHETEDGILTYVVHNEPFPLKDTEMSVRYLYFIEKDGRTGVRWREAWDESSVQPSKKLNRVETFRGSWCFSPTPTGSTEVINIVQFDPKKMPRWLVEPMVLKFLKSGLEDMREKKPESFNPGHSSNSVDIKQTQK